MNASKHLRKRWHFVRAGGICVALGISALATGCQKADSTPTQETQLEAVPVAVVRPFIEDAVHTIAVNGDIKADQQVTLSSTIAGRLVDRPVELGDAVRKGQIIATVDHAALDQAVAQARAGLAAAQEQATHLASELARVERLFSAGGASQQQLDAIRTQKRAADEAVKQARAMLEQALIRRRDADIRAPFDGLIGKLFVEVGDMVAPGAPVAIIVDPDPLVATVRIPERDIGVVHPGQPAKVSVAAYPDTSFPGTVRRISPVVDPATRMVEVEVLLPNPEQKLKPGMFATVYLEVDRHPNALMLPTDAVLQESRIEGGDVFGDVKRVYYVYIYHEGKAVKTPVTLGYITGHKVEILSGITAEDSVIVRGQHLVQDGQPVVLRSSSQEGV